MFHVKHRIKCCFFNKICYYIYGAININGTRSGQECSSLNVLYLCAPFLVGDYMNNDIKYMKIALMEAQKAYDKGEIPIGAVIVKDNKVLAKAHNLKESTKQSTKHAEIIAIEKASKKLNNWRLLDCTIYVTMFPCPMCASAINQARISRLVYGTIPEYVDKQQIISILNDKNYGLPVEIVDNILSDDCLKLIQKFFVKKRQ